MSPKTHVFWRGVFRVKAVWNWVASVGFFLGDDALRDWLVLPRTDPVYRALFLSQAFAFGLGFWRVSGNLDENHDIVRMGVFAQLAVFVVAAYAVGFAAEPLPWPFLLPGIIDLVFAVAFLVFLRTYPRGARAEGSPSQS
jgi:hypothetical protein